MTSELKLALNAKELAEILSENGVCIDGRISVENIASEIEALVTRAVPDVPELVRYRMEGYEITFRENGYDQHDGFGVTEIEDPRGKYVLHSQAAEIIAAKDVEIAGIKDCVKGLFDDRAYNRERAEAAEAKLAQMEKQLDQAMSVHRWSVDEAGSGALYVCRDNHEKGEPCEWEKFIPADTTSVANDADLKAENEKLRGQAMRVIVAFDPDNDLDNPEKFNAYHDLEKALKGESNV